jgi:hypothetical protein
VQHAHFAWVTLLACRASEAGAGLSVCQGYSPNLVSGLLQTSEYAAAVLRLVVDFDGTPEMPGVTLSSRYAVRAVFSSTSRCRVGVPDTGIVFTVLPSTRTVTVPLPARTRLTFFVR